MGCLATTLVTLGLLVCLIHQTESRYLDSWLKVENFTHQNVIKFVHNYENDFTTIISSSDVSSKCRSSLIDYKNGLLNFELTSVKRLDSSGKWPSGVLAGTFTDLGSFDSCIALDYSQYCLLYTNVPLFNETSYEGFMRPYDKGRFNFSTEPFVYFSKYIHFLRRMNITTGLCVPDECSREELKLLVGKFFDRYNTGLTADVDLCYKKPETVTWRPSEAIGLGIIVFIIFLNWLGTWVSDESLLSAFNWSANRRKLFTVDSVANYESLSFLDGIKVFTMFLVVLSHFQMGNMFNLYMEVFRFNEVVANPTFVLAFLAPYTVDLFLMVTGLLMGHYFFSGKRRLNLIPYIMGRWIRFATIIGWIICLQFVFFGEHFHHYFGGPMWSDYNAIGSIVQSCERTWFPTLLLNQFWFDSSEDVNVCLLFDWYLAADFILAILFLIVLIPYLKNHKKLSLFITIAFIIIGIFISGLGIYQLNIPTTWIATNFQRKPFLEYSFDFNLKPWPHIGPYFVGVLFGYIISCPKLVLSNFALAFGWMVCTLCLSINFLYEYVVNRYGYDPEYPIAFIYGTVSKTIWAIGWAWLILILKLGYLQPISNYLSRPAFRILSRINLSTLCTNMMIIRLRSGSTRTLTYPAYSEALLFYYLPLYIVIYAMSTLSTLLVEFPTVNLLKRLFTAPKKSSKQQGTEGNNNVDKPMVITKLVIANSS